MCAVNVWWICHAAPTDNDLGLFFHYAQWINGNGTHKYTPMQMGTGRAAALSHPAKQITLGNTVAFFNEDPV